MRHTLGKKERLKRKKLIDQLYSEGKSIKCFPLRMIFLQKTHNSEFPCQAGFSVPKRIFKKAVHRNRIKRLLRESYRLQKDIVYNTLNTPYIFMISYIGKEELPYTEMHEKMRKLLELFIKKKNEHEEKNIQ